MISFPCCKINLGLNVISKRQDGYHDIETCFYPLGLTDVLEIIPSKKVSFTSSGLAIPGSPDENLCVKAYTLLKRDYQLDSIQIHLHKTIPFGAGLGGGSSDAVSTLVMLNSIFELNLSHEELLKHCKQIGSDCAFFLENRPMIGKGRGDELEPATVNLKGKFIVLVKAGVHISTAEAYAHILPKKATTALKEIVEKEVSVWRDVLANGFEESVFKKYPEIETIKNKLYECGALYASMSGSGSALFGIFNNEVDLRNEFQGMTYWSGILNS